MDLKNYPGTLEGKKLLGVFVRNIGNPDNSICFELLLHGPNGTINNLRACMPYDNDRARKNRSRKYMVDILAKKIYIG